MSGECVGAFRGKLFFVAGLVGSRSSSGKFVAAGPSAFGF